MYILTTIGRHPPNEGDAVVIFDVTPGENPDLGDYVSATTPQSRYTVQNGVYLMTFTSYQILRHVCPQLEPHHLYRLFSRDGPPWYRDNGTVYGVDYGPLRRVHMNRYAYWPALAEIPDELEDEEPRWWDEFLSRAGKTDDELVEEAWMGPGNLWAMVRPDRFPIAETLSMGPLMDCGGSMDEDDTDPIQHPATFNSLPFDILELIADLLPIESLSTLISISTHSRAVLLPYIHSIAYLKLLEEPWLFPVPNLPGRSRTESWPKEETEYWVAEWLKGDVDERDIVGDAPWLNYARAFHALQITLEDMANEVPLPFLHEAVSPSFVKEPEGMHAVSELATTTMFRPKLLEAT
ncbi:hypothetical protein AX16_000776 [Volvariella volvacea WC 439]|nr:hypothetical protein AX16_000776 [Volvariella volvacea WC 439]